MRHRSRRSRSPWRLVRPAKPKPAPPPPAPPPPPASGTGPCVRERSTCPWQTASSEALNDEILRTYEPSATAGDVIDGPSTSPTKCVSKRTRAAVVRPRLFAPNVLLFATGSLPDERLAATG